jgi:broad specificity phosphatase PhoE
MRRLPRLHTRFILVRHGQSDFNAQGRVQGCSDEPSLTNAGRRAANDVATYLRRAGINQVITSPLRRACDFAARMVVLLKDSAPLPVEVDGRLREIELPLWEGLEIAELERSEPELYRWWRERPQSFVMRSGWRPVPDLYARATSFWRDSADRFRGQTVLVVTHAGTVRALVATALGISPDRFHSIQQSNGGLTILDTEDGASGFELVCLNATGHLGESLPKLKDGRTGVRVLLLGNETAGLNAYRQFRPRFEGISIDRCVTDSPPQPVRIGPGFHTQLWALHPSEVTRQLARALGENVQDRRFRKAALGLTVLHFASSNRPPVLQMIDLPESQRWPAGNEVGICS